MKYYLASIDGLMNRKIKPRVPESIDSDEDDITPRIYISQSIDGCLKAIGQQIMKGDDVYIYETEVNTFNDIYQPTMDEVYDVFITGECWLLTEATFHLGMILVIKDKQTFMTENKQVFYNFNYEILIPKNLRGDEQ